MKPVIVLTGPTGSGKSHIVYSLSSDLPVEIINADSRQIYRHMQIGTAMPDNSEMERFRHHLFAFLEPSQPFSAGQYARLCKNAIDEIHSRNHIPLIVGGTFFYIKAIWDGLIENINIPAEIQNRVHQLGKDEAYDLLTRLDSQRASKLFPSDEHRVKRSLMLSLSTNQQISHLPKSGGIYANFNFTSFYVDFERSLLYDRINQRVKIMFEKGLLEEVQKLTALGFTSRDPGMNAIGYKEILQISLDNRLLPDNWPEQIKNTAINTISQATRNFAKRQLTWFRNESRLKRIDPIHAVSLLSGLILQFSQKKIK